MTDLKFVKHFQSENNLNSNQVVIHGDYFAIAKDRDIVLSPLDDDLQENIKLIGHHTPVSALCLNSSIDSTLLASAGSAYLIVWDMKKNLTSHERGDQLRGAILQELHESPCDLSLSSDNSKLCVVMLEEFYVLSILDRKIVFREICQPFRCTNAKFLSDSCVVAAFDDGKIQVWDICESNNIWNATFLSGSISSLTTSLSDNSFALGFSNGIVRLFVGAPDSEFKKNIEIDTDKELFRYNLSDEDTKESCTSGLVIAVFITEKIGNGRNHDNSYKIFCATNQVLFVIDYRNQNVKVFPFQKFEIRTVESAHFCQCDENSVTILTSSLLESRLCLLKYCLDDIEENDIIINFLPKEPLLENSILRIDISKTKAKKPEKVKNKPLTFHSKIKSSGYTATPHRKMFVPLTSRAKPKNNQEKLSVRKMPNNIEEPTDWSELIYIKNQYQISDTSCTINHISMSYCNRYVASSLSNNSIVISQRGHRGQPSVLCGHNGSVLKSGWSMDGSNIITCSADCTAKVWSFPSYGKPVLTFENAKNNSTKKQEKIGKDVTHAQFYYIDKFVILSYGNSFSLYTYYLDSGPKNDIKRYLETNRYKLVKNFQIPEAQAITSLCAPNNLYSYIIMACGSDKTLQIYDMNVGRNIAQVPELHSRPVNRIIHRTGSSFLPCYDYNIFATSAASDGIKLWDLRTLQCVIKYNSHPNTGICPFDMTPDGRCIATAGDDRCLHLYDVRSNALLQTSTQQKEKFSSVAFSKDGHEIFTGLLQGTLATFSVT